VKAYQRNDVKAAKIFSEKGHHHDELMHALQEVQAAFFTLAITTIITLSRKLAKKFLIRATPLGILLSLICTVYI
jgi:hypothetical protein